MRSRPLPRALARAACLALPLLALPLHAAAQDATSTAPEPAATPAPTTVAPASTEPTASAPAPTAASTPAASSATATPARPRALPIMVAVLTTGRVPEELATATRDALVAQVGPMAGGRPVLALAADDIRATLTACTEPTCVGAELARVQAFGAVIARLSRRTVRGPVTLSLELVDPVSGAPRIAPLAGQLTDVASAATTLAPLAAQLQPVMFSPPPPPPTLLVTANVDGSHVRVDEQDLGDTPLARATLTAGHHTVSVTHDGYVAARRTIDLTDGEASRLDVVLVAATPGFGDDTVASPVQTSTPWYEEPLVWVGVGGGVLVVTGIIIGVAVASSSGGETPSPMGIPLPSID